MTFEEKVAMANTVRSRDRFGPVSPEELAALPGTEKEMWVEVADADPADPLCSPLKAGVCMTAQRIPEAMHGFTTNRTPGWERALKKHIQFFREHLQEDNL